MDVITAEAGSGRAHASRSTRAPKLQEEVSLPDLNAEEKDAERIYQVQTAMVKGEDQSSIGVVAIFNDITEIRSIERMKTAFVSTVSHELRTPLTSIKGFISTLLQDVEGFYDKDTVHEFYTIIDQECDRLTRLISDLLNVSQDRGRARARPEPAAGQPAGRRGQGGRGAEVLHQQARVRGRSRPGDSR